MSLIFIKRYVQAAPQLCAAPHLLRCSPSASHSALLEFDSLLKTAIERITNSSLTDSLWPQASLPIRDGGLGVRRVSSLAIPTFLASAASTVSLQDEILANCWATDSCADDPGECVARSLLSQSYRSTRLCSKAPNLFRSIPLTVGTKLSRSLLL